MSVLNTPEGSFATRGVAKVLEGTITPGSPTTSRIIGAPRCGQNLRVTRLDAGVTATLQGSLDGSAWVDLGALRPGDNVMKSTVPLYRIQASATQAGNVEVWQYEMEV